MTGTIYNLSRSQQLDINSKIIAGALLYIYSAGTTTPADTFSDFLLTQINPWPLESDSSGRFPAIWVADGAYRARMTDSNAILIFDDDNVQAIGPSTGTPVGPGIDTTGIRTTGDFFWLPVDTTRSGSVRANGRTIGSVSSGATERANADTQPLYEFLWNNFSNTDCPVTGGRGVSAVIDFNANKSIATYDMRGRNAHGLDTMGNSAAGIISGGTTAAAKGGAETSTALLAHTHAISITTGGVSADHIHSGSVATSITNGTAVARNLSVGTDSPYSHAGGQTLVSSVSATSSTLSLASGAFVTGGASADHTHLVDGTSGSSGSGASYSVMSPYSLGTWYIKL